MTANTKVTRRLNDKWRIAWFDAIVVLPFLFFLMMGFATGNKILGGVVGLAAAWQLQRLKASKHASFLTHFFRWVSPRWALFGRFESFPSPEKQARLG